MKARPTRADFLEIPVNRTYTDNPEHDYGPTRTQQRRDALAVLALANQLVELPPSKLAKLDLPEDVQREIAQTRRITAHIARKRQLAFLAKVMRRHDAAVFDGVRAALGENRERQRQETAPLAPGGVQQQGDQQAGCGP